MKTKINQQTIDVYIIFSHITQLLKQIESENPKISTKTSFDKSNSLTTYNYNQNEKSPKPSSITIDIGVKDLFNPNNITNGEIPISELIRYTEIVFHEKQHAKQFDFLFQQKKPEKWIIDAARHEFTTRAFPSYYWNNYWNQAIEADAEENGMKDTVKYFDTHYIHNNKPKYDARNILFELNQNRQIWYLPQNTHFQNFEDMLQKLHSKKLTITNQLQELVPVTYDQSNPKEIELYAFTEKFLTDPIFENHRKAFKNATNGIERDKVLLQVILRENLSLCAVPNCLRKECKAYLKAFKHTDKSTIIPSSMVYSIMAKDDADDRINQAMNKFENIIKADELTHNKDFTDFKF